MRALNEMGDAELIERAKEHSGAFGVLYERYVDRIYNYVYYRTGSTQDAEDLTARTFHRALKNMPRYVHRGIPFSAWLYRIAHNLVANWHRDNSRRQVVPLNETVVAAHRREQPEAMVEAQEDQDRLLRVIRRLPQERQQLLILKFVERMSNAEIAQVMGRTEGAIKSLYHRTLIALREMLASERTEWPGQEEVKS
jgi:RNA polymerase sigma-70 factor (ECF subfamily)